MFQLRYLQTLNSISAENNSTIVFPVPIDVISAVMGGKQIGPGPSMMVGSRGSVSSVQYFDFQMPQTTQPVSPAGPVLQ